MAKDKYRPGVPPAVMGHEMWSREICDRLDELITLVKAQNATLVGDRAKNVQVEITEPDDSGSKAPAKSEEKAVPAAKPAPAKAASAARTTSTSSTTKK